MPLILDTAPATDPVTLAEVKAHIRVDHTDEDARIGDFIRAATQRFDGRDGSLGCCLITQTWELVLDAFPRREIGLDLWPIQSVLSVSYDDPEGVAQTVAPANYVVDKASRPGWIVPVKGFSWPATLDAINVVRIRFRAGFGDNPGDVPEPIRTAIKMRVGHLYEHRESVIIGSGFVTDMPDGAEDFVRNFRTWTF